MGGVGMLEVHVGSGLVSLLSPLSNWRYTYMQHPWYICFLVPGLIPRLVYIQGEPG